MKRRSGYLPASGETYEKQRMRAFVRDDFTCKASSLRLPDIDGCTETEPETKLRKLQCHHKKMRINGGDHDLENLITICNGHHNVVHPWMKTILPMREKEMPYGTKELEYGKKSTIGDE